MSESRIVQIGDSSKAEVTPAGLIVPKGTIEKKSRTMIRDTFKKFRRMFRDAMAEGIVPVYLCRECKKPTEIVVGRKLIEVDILGNEPPGGEVIALECECTRWEVR